MMQQPENHSPGKILALLVDDEAIARRGLRSYLAGEADVEIVGECANGLEAVKAIAEKAPDVVFLDVQMPGMDGFAVIEEIGIERMPKVIFVTAYDQYAIRAFEVQALDYLLKPFDKTRLLNSLRRIFPTSGAENKNEFRRSMANLIDELRREREENQRATPTQTLPDVPFVSDRIAVKKSGRIFFINTSEIDWIEAAENYVELHSGNEIHLVRGTLSGLESRLDSRSFLRIRRNVLINIDRIKELQPLFKGEFLIVFSSGAKVVSSRRFRKSIGQRLLGE